MALLSIRQRQIDALVKMLNLNAPTGNSTPLGLGSSSSSAASSDSSSSSDAYKVLLLDRFCRDLLSPLLKVSDLRKHGVTLHLLLDSDRQTIPDVPAVYFAQPTASNLARITQDAGRGLYDKMHLNFTSSLPRPLLEQLATATLKSDSVHRVSRVFDQYLEFVSLGPSLFSLAQPLTYLQLNDPTAKDKDVEAAVDCVVNGLFCVLATLGTVPYIRCPDKGGPAEMAARQLDARLRAHLVTQNNLFKEAASTGAGGGLPPQRPLLLLVDRNFDLPVAVQHAWTYRPLVHDLLGMRLNRVTLSGAGNSFEVDESDPFWASHSDSPFPKAAEEVDFMLKKWKEDKERVNKQPGEEEEVEEEESEGLNTRKLTAAMNAVPELVERKRLIDKHISIGGALLDSIKSRAVDAFFSTEEDVLGRGPAAAADRAAVLDLLRKKGTQEDKLRLAIVFLLATAGSSAAKEAEEAVDAALAECDADLAAVHYIRKMRRLNSSIAAAYSSGSGGGAGGLGAAAAGSKDDLLDWAGKLYGQSISRVTAGVKNLLSAGRQLALTRVVESLMDAKPLPETEGFLLLDPRSPKGTAPLSGSSAAGRGPFREGIVFVIGGGNYIEYGGLQEYARKQQPAKNVIYGASELLSGAQFVGQLADLGRRMGYVKPTAPAGGSH